MFSWLFKTPEEPSAKWTQLGTNQQVDVSKPDPQFATHQGGINRPRPGEDDQGNDNDHPDSDPTPKDALKGFMDELEAAEKNFAQSKLEWKDLKEKIISESDLTKKDFDDLGETENKKERTYYIMDVFSNLYRDVDDFFKSAEKNLEHTRIKLWAHITSLCDRLDELCKNIKNEDKQFSEAEIIKFRIRVCDTCNAIINKLELLITKIRDEINLCLDGERIAEEVTLNLIGWLIRVVTQIPLPNMGFSFTEQYRDYLSKKINPEQIRVEQLLSNIGGVMGKAKRVAGSPPSVAKHGFLGEKATNNPQPAENAPAPKPWGCSIS